MSPEHLGLPVGRRSGRRELLAPCSVLRPQLNCGLLHHGKEAHPPLAVGGRREHSPANAPFWNLPRITPLLMGQLQFVRPLSEAFFEHLEVGQPTFVVAEPLFSR